MSVQWMHLPDGNTAISLPAGYAATPSSSSRPIRFTAVRSAPAASRASVA
jgi:hypothetical protein